MSLFRSVADGWWCSLGRCALMVAFLAGVAATVQSITVSCAEGEPGHAASIADYRKHLEALDGLVVACQKQRSACDPAQVGEDERVLWTVGAATESREIRYGWLRLLLEQAAKKDAQTSETAGKLAPLPDRTGAATKTPQSTDTLLKQARERLAEDWKQAGGAGQTLTNRSAERKTLTAILARKEYQGVKKLTAREQLMEKLTNWLNEFLARLASYAARSPWIGFAIRGLLLAGILLGLGWGLLQIERRSRLQILPDSLTSSGIPSAREWQLWLKDAQALAARGLWREAIHCVYWASISRLEAGHLWPADRARTPREYLALIPGDDPRKASLAALTRSFERTWYGGRAADSEEFQRSLGLAAELGVQ